MNLSKAHSAWAERGKDGRIEQLSFAIPLGPGESNVHLNGEAARKAAAELTAAGVPIHCRDGHCIPGRKA